MSTVIRPELSVKNKYWISKHRYYELKHFCLQYLGWKKSYRDLDGLSGRSFDHTETSRSTTISDPTSRIAEERIECLDKMKLIEQTAIVTDPNLATYILKGVTEELSYSHLKSKLNIPCGKDMYYDRYRRFFWLLDKARD